MQTRVGVHDVGHLAHLERVRAVLRATGLGLKVGRGGTGSFDRSALARASDVARKRKKFRSENVRGADCLKMV